MLVVKRNIEPVDFKIDLKDLVGSRFSFLEEFRKCTLQTNLIAANITLHSIAYLKVYLVVTALC